MVRLTAVDLNNLIAAQRVRVDEAWALDVVHGVPTDVDRPDWSMYSEQRDLLDRLVAARDALSVEVEIEESPS